MSMEPTEEAERAEQRERAEQAEHVEQADRAEQAEPANRDTLPSQPRAARDERGYPGAALLGGVLVVLGVLFLVTQQLNIDLGDVGWPFFVIAPGLAIAVLGLTMRGGAGMTIAGSIATVVGLVLLYQNTTNHWESWAYAWALVGPTAAGVGSVLAGTRNGNRGMVRAGVWQALAGLGLFAVGLVFL